MKLEDALAIIKGFKLGTYNDFAYGDRVVGETKGHDWIIAVSELIAKKPYLVLKLLEMAHANGIQQAATDAAGLADRQNQHVQMLQALLMEQPK
jgi:hypothetical protein